MVCPKKHETLLSIKIVSHKEQFTVDQIRLLHFGSNQISGKIFNVENHELL